MRTRQPKDPNGARTCEVADLVGVLNFSGFSTQLLKERPELRGPWLYLISYPQFSKWFISYTISFISIYTSSVILYRDFNEVAIIRFSSALINSCWVFYVTSQLPPSAQRCNTFLRMCSSQQGRHLGASTCIRYT